MDYIRAFIGDLTSLQRSSQCILQPQTTGQFIYVGRVVYTHCSVYHIYQPLRCGVWIPSFPSPRLVASPRLKNLVCPTIVGRIIGFIPFPRVLVLCEMQPISSRIWTRVAVYISRDDNHYTTGTVYPHCVFVLVFVLPPQKVDDCEGIHIQI